MKNIINKIINESLKNSSNITIYVDIFNLHDYSLVNIYKLIIFNNKFNISDLKFIKNIELYINITNKNIIFKYINLLKNICPINININYIKHKKKWDKIFKD
tara:strand:- start:2115 stop:2420 length:306 start_codon:yes stop_codon:yes gene_type:complete